MEKIKRPFNELVNYISKYESDTFSASQRKITLEEASEIAAQLVNLYIKRCTDGVMLDGTMIEERLFDMRMK